MVQRANNSSGDVEGREGEEVIQVMKKGSGWVIPKWLVVVRIIVVYEHFWLYAYRTKCNCDPNGMTRPEKSLQFS